MRAQDLAELRAFAAVVECGSFAKAASQLRISPSSLSQVIKSLEARVGARLLNRTTRRLALTGAGARLHARLKPALDDINAAIGEVVDAGEHPSGTLRVRASHLAVRLFIEPILGVFRQQCPYVVLDVTVEEALTDLRDEGFDMGIRLGEFLDPDMVAFSLGAKQRQIAVASPDYIARRGEPRVPSDLVGHDCINWRAPGASRPQPWEFMENGRWFQLDVDGPLVVSSRDLAAAAAVQGVGIAFWAEARFEELIARRALVPLLEEWCAPFPGWFLYYPRQARTPAAVRAFAELIRRRAG